jgi:hypothetical protein
VCRHFGQGFSRFARAYLEKQFFITNVRTQQVSSRPSDANHGPNNNHALQSSTVVTFKGFVGGSYFTIAIISMHFVPDLKDIYRGKYN